MLTVEKGPEPRSLAAYRSTPGARWDAISGAVKGEMRASLAAEQRGLCAYCQRRIRPDDLADGVPTMQVEHWVARAAAEGAALELVWSNLLGVCRGRSGDQRHCDAARADAPLSLCPIVGRGLAPRDHLRYLGDGRVASDHPDAARDLVVLNLDAPNLRRGRREALDAVRLRFGTRTWTADTLDREIARLDVPGPAEEHVEVVRAWLVRQRRRR